MGRLVGLVAAGAIVLGATTVATVVLVQETLVDDEVYRDAFVRSDAYERVYTEVFADPELAALNDDLIGRLSPSSAGNAVQLRAVGTSALRWTVPPARLRAGTEAVLAQLLAYVRGESARLDGSVSVSDILARVDDAAMAEVRTVLADAAASVAVSFEDYEVQIRAFADELADGRVPDAVPVFGGAEFDPQRVLDLLFAELGDRIDDRTREQLTAAAYSANARDALIDAGAVLVAEHANRVSEQARATTIGGEDIDVIDAIADRAEIAPRDVVARFNEARTAARWLSWRTAWVGGVAVVVGVGVIAWRGRTRPRRAVATVGACVAAAGLLFAMGAYGVAHEIGSPLATAADAGPRGWSLPESLRVLLADIEHELRSVFRARVLVLAAGFIAAGGVLVLGALVVARERFRLRHAGALTVGALAAAAVTWGFPTEPSAATPDRACNGAVELCERRYDDVVYAATHNSMSSPDVVFVWPEHDHGIRTQLDMGVRALLIDTHEWTELVSAADLERVDPFLPELLRTRLYDSLAARREARPGAYLCHNHCALGAVPLVEALREVRSFLDDNPREVVTLIVQDAITTAATVDAFERAGLDRYLHTHRSGSRWATLGELIERDERLVVFAEKGGPPPHWYHQAFEHIQETPYLFLSPEAFSCAPNRGRSDASLFLMNHWVQRVAPDRADAAVVNRRDVIVARAEQCRRERGLLPNFIAVNFANVGDVRGAVDALNGL